VKSFLRWAGSKRTLLRHLRTLWQGDEERYIEPFCGSACLFFDLQPSRAVLGDLNSELIETFRSVKNIPQLVMESLRRLQLGEAPYYKLRKVRPIELAQADRAARFLYLNRMCFNGIYRTNLEGDFNVPYGPPRSGRPVDELTVFAASKALRDALIVAGDFEHTLERVQPGDFIYLDPPYCLDNRRVFREYVPGSFSSADLVRLARQLDRLNKLGAKFVITYADSREARELFALWKPRRVRVKRHIAGFSHHRRHAYELIATNF
jgi:DNA adenine methylase